MKLPPAEEITLININDSFLLAQYLKKAWDGDYFIVFEVINQESNYYTQFALSKESSSLEWEFVSNEYLDPQFRISDEKIQLLINRGFIYQDPELYKYPSPNIVKSFIFKELDDNIITLEFQKIMKEAIEIFIEIYELKYPIQIKIKFVK